MSAHEEAMRRLRIPDLETASVDVLLFYFMARYKMQHGYEYMVDKPKDTATVRAFRTRYKEHSGAIIQLLFDKYKGRWGGEIQSTACLSRGSKWITDKLYSEVQEGRKREEERETRGEITSAESFLEMFS